jgi:hypothetical protein
MACGVEIVAVRRVSVFGPRGGDVMLGCDVGHCVVLELHDFQDTSVRSVVLDWWGSV